MTGENELHLNQATMIQVLQFWLNSRMVAPVPTIVDVNVDRSGMTFIVKIDS